MTKFPDRILLVPEKIDFKDAPIRYSAVGRCIYCGDQSGPFGDEHIVPYGLARNSLVLPSASCKRCETVTGKIEQDCLRRTFGPLRAGLGAPTRNKKDRKPTLRLNRIKFETMTPGETAISLEPLDLPPSEFPLAFIGLLLDQPGILLNLPLGTPLPWDWFYTYKKDETQKLLQGEGHGIHLGELNPYVFAQFLAKIAYSYAVAVRGHGSFEPLVLDLIFGRTHWFRHWVGGDPMAPALDENQVHAIRCTTQDVSGHSFVVVTLRLFSFLGTPIYRVVVGEVF